MRRNYLIAVSFLVLVLSGVQGVLGADAFAPIPDLSRFLTPSNLARLEKGEVLRENETIKDAGGAERGRGVAIVLIHADIDKIIATIDDFETYPQWMPEVTKTQVLLREGNRRDVSFELSVMWNTVKYTCIHRIDSSKGIFEWRMDEKRERKNVSDSTGAWVMKSLGPGKTAVAYTVLVDVGFAVPNFIQDYLAGRSLPEVAKALRDRVEGKK